MTTTVLLTGFEPFNLQPINPAWEAVRALEGWREEGIAVHVRQLPCVFGDAADVLREAIDATRPDVVIAVGQAGGRADITVERVAINIDDAPIADNRAVQLVDEPIVPDGPAAYFASLPIKAIVHALRAAGLPASVSQTAGTFVCNHVFYQLMHMVRAQPGVRAGFIHIPFLPQQAARQPMPTASMALVDMVEGLKVAVRTACAVQCDWREAGGGTH